MASKKQKHSTTSFPVSSAPSKPYIPSSQRDQLTGDPLPKVRSVVYPVRDFNPQRLKNRYPLPVTIHRNVAEGHLGGCLYTQQMAKYIGRIHRSGLEDQVRWYFTYWWLHPIAERELRANFPQDIVDTIFRIHLEGQTWEQAAQNMNRSVTWISLQDSKMAAHIRRIMKIRK